MKTLIMMLIASTMTALFFTQYTILMGIMEATIYIFVFIDFVLFGLLGVVIGLNLVKRYSRV